MRAIGPGLAGVHEIGYKKCWTSGPPTPSPPEPVRIAPLADADDSRPVAANHKRIILPLESRAGIGVSHLVEIRRVGPPMQRILSPMIGRPGQSRRLVRPRLPSGAMVPGWLALAMVPLLIGAGPDDDNKGKDRTGEQIYRQMCASCHGAVGRGDRRPLSAPADRRALGGRAWRSSSPRRCRRTTPGTCVGPDAEKVSAYIYDAFYSKAAQARNPMRPARIELSRLTVRQYRNAVTDLIGSFRGPPGWDDRRGLKAEYSRAARSASGRRRAATASQSRSTRRSGSTSAPIARSRRRTPSRSNPGTTSRCRRCRSPSTCSASSRRSSA